MGIAARAIKNLSRRKTRAVLVIIALTLALTLLVVLPPSINARESLTQKVVNSILYSGGEVKSTVTLSANQVQCGYWLNSVPATMTVGVGGSMSYLAIPVMNQSLYDKIKSIPDVTNIVPILQVLSTANRSYSLYGIPLDNASLTLEPSVLSANITEGRNLRVGDSGVVVLDESVAERFNATVGGTFTVSGRNFTVVGIDGDVQQTQVFMSLTDAQTVTNDAGDASLYNVFVDNVNNVNTVASRISGLDPNLQVADGAAQISEVETLENQLAQLNQTAQSNLSQIQGMGLSEIGIAVVADVAIILFIMLYSVRERTKEIGALKAMGAGDSTVLGQFIFEGVILSAVAAVFAIVIGVFVVPTLSSILLPAPQQVGVNPLYLANGTVTLMPVTWGHMPFLGSGPKVIPVAITLETAFSGFGAALLLGAVGSLYPALKAARTRPAEAMRFE